LIPLHNWLLIDNVGDHTVDLLISPQVLERFPSYRLMVITGSRVRVSAYDEQVDDLLKRQEEQIRNTIELSGLHQHPHISAWRKAYAGFGAKPGKHRCAVEALMRAILKRKSLPRINSLVDLCNCVSVKHVLPIDVMDLDNIEGDISVRFAEGDERFLPLGSSQLEPPNPGEVIYSDGVDVLGRRWNWRKSEKSKVTLETNTILITIEGIGDIATETLGTTEAELCSLLRDFCGGTLATHYLNVKTSQVCVLA
jgi:DNA/RNA-binding domain of Phe-tRNA-synthetase-like protein